MTRIKYFLPVIFIFLFAACGSGDHDDYGPDALQMKVSTDALAENTIYPSLLLGTGKLSAQSDEEFDLFDVSFNNPQKGANIKIKFEATKLNLETTYSINHCEKGEQTVSPRIKWDYDALAACRTQGLVDFTVVAYLDDQETDRCNLRMNYRSVNECVFGVYDPKSEEYTNLAWLFGAYVNENNLRIDPLLQKIKSNGVVNKFIGYQGDSHQVLLQAFAIWHELQLRGVAYSNVTMTSNPTQVMATQYVRLFDEVLDNTQANCVDGTVFISSVLRKIGIEPIMIMIPGHMYLAYYLGDGQTYYLLETTLVGMVDLPGITAQNAKAEIKSRYVDTGLLPAEDYNYFVSGAYTLDQIKTIISYESFLYATNVNLEEHREYAQKFNEVLFYEFLPVKLLRQLVQPIESVTSKSKVAIEDDGPKPDEKMTKRFIEGFSKGYSSKWAKDE